MSDGSQGLRRDNLEQKDKYIPPPMDPYATYQTPYERRQSPEPNPFIEFRRFADKQFSDIFSGFQTFANFPKMFGVEDGMKELREQLERDMKEMIAREKMRNDYMDSLRSRGNDRDNTDESLATITPTTALSTAIHGSNLAPKASSEGTVESGTENSQKWITATGADGKTWNIDSSTGVAVPKPSETSTSSRTEQQDDRRMRWKRGFRNCPELKKYRGETELDMYETYEDLQKQSRSAGVSSTGRPSWSSWLSAYGYDGIQKSKKSEELATDTPPRQQERPSGQECDLEKYHLFQTRRMNPLVNDQDFLPWIVLSPYSPAFLANPDAVQLSSITAHNGCEGGCDSPMHIYTHRFSNKPIDTDQEPAFRTRLSGQVPWIDAFEDLLSLERTGKMPERDPDSCSRPRDLTTTWIGDLVERGILGPKWSVRDGEIIRDSRDDPAELRRTKERNQRSRKLEENLRRVLIDPYLIAMREEDEAKTAGPALGDKHALGKSQAQQQRSVGKARPSQEVQVTKDVSSVQPRPEGKRVENPQSTHTSLDVTPVSQQQQSQTKTTKPIASVISTLTTTTSRTRLDGSVETRRVLKKRFADGNEESEESTEVVYPQTSKQSEQKQGWFWT